MKSSFSGSKFGPQMLKQQNLVSPLRPAQTQQQQQLRGRGGLRRGGGGGGAGGGGGGGAGARSGGECDGQLLGARRGAAARHDGAAGVGPYLEMQIIRKLSTKMTSATVRLLS